MTHEEKEDKAERLNQIALRIKAAVQEARDKSLPYIWLGQSWGDPLIVAASIQMPDQMRLRVTVVLAPPVPIAQAGERELDRWTIKALWAALDQGLLGDITEEDFHRAFLYREQEAI